ASRVMQRERLSDETIREDREKMVGDVSEIIRLYGGTVRSLPEGEQLIVQITWPRNASDLPKKTELRSSARTLSSGGEPQIVHH
ncbi:MAG: hypothetical protein ACNA78_11430, partial [Balneolaceae bacterium]